MSNHSGNGHAATLDAPCLDAALEYHAMGLPVVLCVGKNPGAAMGADWQNQRFTEREIERRFEREPTLNVGVTLGPASGLIDLECDTPGADQSYLDLFADCEMPIAPTHLARRGRHRWFKYHSKLGTIAALPRFQNKEKGGAVVHFGELECRLGVGAAAQSLLPPSTTDGYTRQWVEGLSFAECDAPALPDTVVDRIIAAAAKEFERKEAPKDTAGRCLGGRPGDDFNARASWDDVLKDTGWTFVEQSGAACYWRRPGKSDGWSASTGYCSSDGSGDLFYCFTSSAAPLAAGTAYSKFAVFALLRHNGDFAAAAKALAADGYGDHELNLWKAEGRTDSANARRFVAKFGDCVRYCPPWNQWLRWDGKRWAVDEIRAVEHLAKEVAKGLWPDVAEAAAKDDVKAAFIAELTKWVRYTANGRGIREMLGLARSAPEIVILPPVLDAHPMLLCCENGVVDLETGKLRPHRKEDYLTKMVAAKFDPDARAPTWERFVDEVFEGNGELIGFTQRAAGYSLTGSTKERCLFFLHGKGKNGKSTFVTTLETILADHATSITADMLTVDQKKGIPTEVCDLFGVRLAVTTETEDNTRFAESLLKLLCGGTDTIKGRRLYQNPFQFDATFKLWIAGNHRPRIRGTDDAIWDRVKLIPFNRRFTTPDKDLPAKLLAEADGILAWCVRGCLDWQRHGLGEPEAVTKATRGYRDENDVLGHFVEWCCVVGPAFKVRAGDLFAAYRKWAEASAEVVVSQRKFGEAMSDRFNKYTNNGVWYAGVGLKEGETDEF